MKYFISIALSLIAAGAFALPLENLLSANQITQLNSRDKPVIETQLSNPSPRIIPQNAELNQLVNSVISSIKPNMMIESLFLYKKPADYHTSDFVWDNDQRLAVFNQLTAISSLTGIQYFSTSRNAMRVFYEYSRIIDGPAGKTTLADPVHTRIPASLTLYARQKDSTFGENVYRYDYSSNMHAIYFRQENVTGLSYGIVPVIGKGNLRSVMAFYDCGDSILIYSASMVNALSLPGLSDRVSNSFRSRAEAVLSWFTGRLNNNLFN